MANRPAQMLDQDLAGDFNNAPPMPEEANLRTNTLSAAIHNLDRTLRSIPSQMSRATIGAVKATGQLAGEAAGKVYNKKATVGMLGASLGGPLASAIAQGLSDSQVIKTIKTAIQEQVKLTGQKTYQSLKNETTGGQGIKFTRSNISPSAMYKASQDQVAAIDRMRVSTVAAIRQTKTMSESDVRKQAIPKAAKGGYVKQTGKAIVHTGEVIVPKTTVERQLKTLNAILDVQNQLLEATSSLKYSLTDDEAGGGGFFKSMRNFGKVFIPILGGGMYKSDIARNPNPFVTMSSALVEQYRWQRLYGELTKRQLNELIKLQGGEQQDVIGKRGVFFEFLEKRQKKLIDHITKEINEKEKRGEGTRIKRFSRFLIGAVGTDMEKFDLQLRYGAIKKATDAVDDAVQHQKSAIMAIFRTAFGLQALKVGQEKEEETPHELMKKMFMREHVATETGGYKELLEKTPSEKSKSKSLDLLDSIDVNVIAIRKLIQEKEKGPEVKKGDFKDRGSNVKVIIMKDGRRVLVDRDDVVEAYKDKDEKNPIVKWLKTLTNITKAEFDETQNQTRSIERIHEEEIKASEKEKKRQSVWERMKGLASNVREAGSTVKSFVESILSSKIGLAALATLAGAVAGGMFKSPDGKKDSVGMTVLKKTGNAAVEHPYIATMLALLAVTKTGRAILKFGATRGWTLAKNTPQLIKIAKEAEAGEKLTVTAGKIVGSTSRALKTADEARKIANLEKLGVRSAEAARLVKGGTETAKAGTTLAKGSGLIEKGGRLTMKTKAAEVAAAGSRTGKAYQVGKALGKAGGVKGILGQAVGPLLEGYVLASATGTAIDLSGNDKLREENKKDYAKFIKKAKGGRLTIKDYLSAALDPANALTAMEDARYEERAKAKEEAKKESYVKEQLKLAKKMKKRGTLTSVKDERLFEALYTHGNDVERYKIEKMSEQGKNVSEIQKWVMTNREKIKSKHEELSKKNKWEYDPTLIKQVDSLCKKWGKDSVIPLLKITGDVRETFRILASGKVTNEFAQKYTQLIQNNPTKKEELLSYMKAEIDPNTAASLMEKRSIIEKAEDAQDTIEQLQDRKKEREEQITYYKEWKSELDKITNKNVMQKMAAEDVPKNITRLESELNEINKKITTFGQPVGDWTGKAKMVVSETGEILIPSQQDVVTAKKGSRINPSNISNDRSETSKKIAASDELTRAELDIKMAKKSSRELAQTTKENANNITNLMTNITNVISSVSGGGNSGSNGRESSFYRNIDAIYAGHPYV